MDFLRLCKCIDSLKFIIIAIFLIIIGIIALFLEVQYDYLAHRNAIVEGECLVIGIDIDPVYDRFNWRIDYVVRIKISVIPDGPEKWITVDEYRSDDTARRIGEEYRGSKITCYYLETEIEESLSLDIEDSIPTATKWGLGLLSVVVLYCLIGLGCTVFDYRLATGKIVAYTDVTRRGEFVTKYYKASKQSKDL